MLESQSQALKTQVEWKNSI